MAENAIEPISLELENVAKLPKSYNDLQKKPEYEILWIVLCQKPKGIYKLNFKGVKAASLSSTLGNKIKKANLKGSMKVHKRKDEIYIEKF